MTRLARAAGALALAAIPLGACRPAEPPRQYPITGQILSVQAERGEITLRHDDVAGLMPAMTMSFPVADRALLDGWQPGDLVAGTLEVSESLGRLVALTRTGHEPLSEHSNSALLAAELLAVGDAVPDAALIDQQDRRRSLSEWFGTPTLVTFIYTRCPLPSFCPLMDRQFAAIQQRAAANPALGGRIRLLTITFDPDYDTPAVLSAHAARLGADPEVWTFLTGDRVTVDRVAARFGVGVMRESDEANTITHNLRTVLIGADGRVAAIYTGSDWTADRALADLAAALRRP
jgi:protein SCO1/2